jgi:hypothetical protein
MNHLYGLTALPPSIDVFPDNPNIHNRGSVENQGSGFLRSKEIRPTNGE